MSPAGDTQQKRVSHVFVTRFNLPTPGPESLVRAQEGWLRSRWDLFSRYTVPSMRAQTSQDYDWLIYFDPESPQWLIDRIAEHESKGLYRPRLRISVTTGELLDDISEIVKRPGLKLLITNLDNDDGLSFDFAERAQRVETEEARAAFYLVNGVIRSGDFLYRRTDRNNAFCSVLEDWSGAVTCWHDWHILLGRHMPTIEIEGSPAWLQVVHDTNVSNRVHGTLIAPDEVAAQFGALVDDALPPGIRRILLDRAVRAPAREVRDRLRGFVKSAFMAVAGKRGLDHLKEFIAKLRRKTSG